MTTKGFRKLPNELAFKGVFPNEIPNRRAETPTGQCLELNFKIKA